MLTESKSSRVSLRVSAGRLARLKAGLPHWGTATSSVLIVAAFPPWELRLLAWFCLVPWFFSLMKARSWKDAFVQGLWFSIVSSLLGFHWVAYVLHQFGELPWALSI